MKKEARSFKGLVALLVLIIICVIGGIVYKNIQKDNRKFTALNYTYQSIEIEHGDTLSSLAEKYTAEGDSKLAWIDKVKEMNNFESDVIYNGRSYLMPVKMGVTK